MIFDLDGTLADCSHRRHFVEPPKVTAEDCNTRDRYDKCIWCEKQMDMPHAKDCSHIAYWKPDWDSFFREDLIMQDEPIEATLAFFNVMRIAEWDFSFLIHICTGRMEKHRKVTDRWLDEHQIYYRSLMMRKDDDFREDYIVKEEMLEALGGPERILFAVDDRNQTVAMWRRHGITCFQVADGDF